MKMVLTTPPTAAVTLIEAKDHLNVDHTDEDAKISFFIAAAVSELDGPTGYLGRCIATQTWTLSLTEWGDGLTIPLRPVASVSVAYDDADAVAQVLDPASYRLVTNWGEDARIEWIGDLPALADGADYPVRIAAVCGESVAPADLRAAILLRVGDLYENREATGADIKVHPAYGHLVSRLRVMAV